MADDPNSPALRVVEGAVQQFTYTAISPFNPGLFITETVWALVALYGLWKIWNKPSKPEGTAKTAAA